MSWTEQKLPLKPWLERGMTVNMWNSDLGLLQAGARGMAELR